MTMDFGLREIDPSVVVDRIDQSEILFIKVGDVLRLITKRERWERRNRDVPIGRFNCERSFLELRLPGLSDGARCRPARTDLFDHQPIRFRQHL
ncbi:MULTISPECIES: hypothetical protein [unclassified Bradyrhizobium]